ncbi:MAG: hypothetical protein KJ621_20280 [Proteobacteria bacterium]|nr:hypothetical protein [Pseudomonadota bacterium]MBU1742370.1 hypothetical protein [Pseudomonadota bacterium]
MATKHKRQTRKELLKTTDQFQTTASRVLDWARANPKIVFTAVVAFVLFLAGVAWFVNYRASRASNISQLYANGTYIFNSPRNVILRYRVWAGIYGGRELADSMPLELGRQALDSVITNAPIIESKTWFQRLVRYSPSSTLAGLALFRLAAIARDQDQPLQAVRLLRRFLARDDVPMVFKPPASLALGQALEEAGRPDEAVKVFGAITSPGYRDLGQFHRTRVLADRARSRGDSAEARRLWRHFLSQFPKSPRRLVVERIVESLPGSRPASGS